VAGFFFFFFRNSPSAPLFLDFENCFNLRKWQILILHFVFFCIRPVNPSFHVDRSARLVRRDC